MSYNKELESRINKALSGWKNTDDKKMFGGVCHLLSGNMFCGVYKNFLILRLGEAGSRDALELPNVKPFDITGRPMKGWVMMEQKGVEEEKDLRAWLNRAKEYVDTLPKK
jgi:hypothetical protein